MTRHELNDRMVIKQTEGMELKTALFDFDGVIMDTEHLYTEFWSMLGEEYLGLEDFGHTIKGQTLIQIFEKYFEGMDAQKAEIVPRLNEFERTMPFEYIPGALEFMKKLKKAGIPVAIVTSSNDAKMEKVYKAHPELLELADAILTSEHFSKSKPDPECFLKAMERLNGSPETTVVFEDSLHGIAAGRASGAYVVGLTTSFPREVIEPLCDMVIEDFCYMATEDFASLSQRDS